MLKAFPGPDLAADPDVSFIKMIQSVNGSIAVEVDRNLETKCLAVSVHSSSSRTPLTVHLIWSGKVAYPPKSHD